jgi:hypothetical protein
MSAPVISVLMAVRNGERHVRSAIDSLLQQTCQDFELIVLDDGSNDDTPEILAAFDDPRLVRKSWPESIGLTRALNRGLALARGRFIARQDADDLSMPRRLELQAAFLESHPQVGLVGSGYWRINEAGAKTGDGYPPLDMAQIRWHLLFHNPFCHSAVMFRRDLLQDLGGGYDDRLSYSQDFDLWSRLLRVSEGANLTEPLVSLREHESSISYASETLQQAAADQIALRNLQAFDPSLDLSLTQVSAMRRCFFKLPANIEPADVQACQTVLTLLRRFIQVTPTEAPWRQSTRALWLTRALTAAKINGIEQLAKALGLLLWREPIALIKLLSTWAFRRLGIAPSAGT